MEATTSTIKPEYVLPSKDAIEAARSKLLESIPESGIGLDGVKKHLTEDVVPGLNDASLSANYYGFVIGGSTPAATFADNLVTKHDQNVHVHLPNDTIATDVEDKALRQLCELLNLAPEQWPHRTFTTGATASNLVGLACGREYVIRETARRRGKSVSVGEDGLLGAIREAGLDGIQVLTTVAHSSLRKAASIIGMGRSCVKDVNQPHVLHKFDLEKLESLLAQPNMASIVAISASEVNTGLFATDRSDTAKIRELCDKYGAWLHVDAAFGLLARALPDKAEYSDFLQGTECMEIADSITGDAHKLINVPYDCGIFLSKHLDIATEVFQNPNAAYLSTGPSSDQMIPSPLNIGIENSRRFRALPVYATLAAYGRQGYRQMLEKQIALARAIAKFILESDEYELLPPAKEGTSVEDRLNAIYIVVLFRAKKKEINETLVQRINGTRKLFVSGTKWDGLPAARFAVANWQVDIEHDLPLVTKVLLEALEN